MFTTLILQQGILIVSFLQSEPIQIPPDLTVWGELSLAIIFRVVIVPALLAFGILKDNNKKTVGYVLMALGILAAGIYSIFTANLDEPFQILTNIASGGFAGLGAVGLHSTNKNMKEWLAARAKKE